MNSKVGSSVFRTGDRTRTAGGLSATSALVALALLTPVSAAFAGGGNWNGNRGNWGNSGTRWGVSFGASNGGTFVGGSYSSGFYGGRGYCPPVARPICPPVVQPYCPPVVRPAYGPGWGRGFYGRPAFAGYRPWYPAVVAPCPPAYLPPVCVTPNTYLVDRPAVSFGVGVAGSSGAGYFSYSSVTPAVSYAAPISPTPVVYSAPSQVVTFVNPNPTVVVQQAQPAEAQTPPPAAQAPEPAPRPATVYQSSGVNGTIDRAQSPASIISVVRAETGDARASAAESFLGRTPAQAWPVTFEGVQDVGGVKEIRCRPVDSLSNGFRPTIIVRGAGDSNIPPRQARGFVTGRVIAISVDDPAYPGGLMVIDEGWVKW